jgi:selenocysteine-specific elongation factor
MKHFVTVGIAGHVDHGKTSLVRALTGIDTDRMKEEKRRGMSMEFGIAPLGLHADVQVSLVDVPGHTDFMKNTIRGLSSVDAAVLVIAADDGVMPQTREHLEILKFLEVRSGFVVLSKADLVDTDTLDIARMEVSDLTAGSFLHGCPIIAFSALDGRGRNDIRSALQSIPGSMDSARDGNVPFRMFIDQIRSIHGLGTVVSGTVLSGSVYSGDRVEIVPSGQIARVRSIQIHHERVDLASGGCRVGINLQGVSMREISRGMQLVEPGRIIPEKFLNGTLVVSGHAHKSLQTGDRVRMFLGTAVSPAFISLMEQTELAPGETGLAQLRPADPMGALPGDRYVITPLNSPMILGGGKILEASSIKFRKAHVRRVVPVMRALESGDPATLVKAWVNARSETVVSAEVLGRMSGLSRDLLHEALGEAARSGLLVPVDDQRFISISFFHRMRDLVADHIDTTVKLGRDHVGPACIVSSLGARLDASVLKYILDDLVQKGRIAAVSGGFTVPSLSRDMDKTTGLDRMTQAILTFIESSGLAPVTLKQILVLMKQDRETRGIRKSLEHLVSRGDVVRLSNERYLSRSGIEEIKARVCRWIAHNGAMRAADCPDVLGYGRTIGVPILEYLDEVGLTERRGNERILKGIGNVSVCT